MILSLENWNDTEVKYRWAELYPLDASKYEHLELTSEQAKVKLTEWRQRLANISWFMKNLNESIARFCNEEDECKGHFWEARFKSQALLDDGAVLAAMAYVDLNPIRARIAQTPETSKFTSIFERIEASNKPVANKDDEVKQPPSLMHFATNHLDNDDINAKIDFKLIDYLELVDTTGRIMHENKKGAIPESLSPILLRLNLSAKGWMNMVKNLEDNFFTGIGHETVLLAFRSQYRTHNPKGLGAAKQCYLQAA